MSSFLKQMKQAANKLGEMVGLENTQTHQQGVDGDPLDEARARLESLRSSFDGMKSLLLNYSRHLLTFSSSAAQVSQEWAGLYSHSPGRSNSLQTFTSNQTKIEALGLKLYKDNYGWDILKVFDDWEMDAQKTLAEIGKTEQARLKVAQLDERTRSLRAAKEKRLKSNQPLSQADEGQLEGAEQILEKYSVMLSNMRVNLDKNLANFFEQRFATLDKAFVRFMEIQIEFFREGAAASSNYQVIVDNYRKRFPRQTGGQYGATPDVLSPLPQVNGMSQDMLSLPTENGAPARAKSTPPARQEDHDDEHPAPQRAPSQQQQRPAQSSQQQQQAKRPVPQQRQDDSSDSDTGTDTDTDSSDEDDDTPKHSPAKKPHSHSHTHAAEARAEAPIDIFHFPATTTAAPAPATKSTNKTAPPAEQNDILDLFGGSSTKPASAAAAPTKKSSTTPSGGGSASGGGGDLDWDWTGGATLAPPAKPISASSSSPALTPSFRQGQAAQGKKLDPFDPFGVSSPQSKPSSSSSSSSSSNNTRARSDSPPPAAPGTTQSGTVLAKDVATHELKDHIVNQQEEKLAALRANDEAGESALQARKEAEGGLEAMLSAWEMNKDGNKKNVRNLLSSVHTVLWPNSGWKPVSIADLLDFNAIKKAHMKIIRIVHPDKVIDATPEQMAIALRVFDTLNSAFDKFKEDGK